MAPPQVPFEGQVLNKGDRSIVTADQIDDRLEKEFARDEQVILNSVRDIMPFGEITSRQRTSLDRLAAIH